jgi:hypothetical protein
MESRAHPSNRSFGTLFASVFLALATWSWWRKSAGAPYLLGLAALFGGITLLRPEWLGPFNRLWMRFAELSNRIVSPIVLAAMYYVILTPFGLFMRLARRDPMRRQFDAAAPTYWIPRQPPGPSPESLRDQF